MDNLTETQRNISCILYNIHLSKKYLVLMWLNISKAGRKIAPKESGADIQGRKGMMTICAHGTAA